MKLTNKALVLGFAVLFLGNMAEAKVLKNPKMKLIDLALSLVPARGYVEIFNGAKIGKGVYDTINATKKICAYNEKAFKTIMEKSTKFNDCNKVLASLKENAKIIPAEAKVENVVIPKAEEQALILVLFEAMLVNNRRFFDVIYDQKYKKYIKACFEESMKDHLDKDGFANSILYKSLDKVPTEVEAFYLSNIKNLDTLFVFVKELLVFLTDLTASLPQAKRSYINHVKKLAAKKAKAKAAAEVKASTAA